MMTAELAFKTLTAAQVAALLGVTRETLRAWIRAGKFPPPHYQGKRKHLWSREKVEKLLQVKLT